MSDFRGPVPSLTTPSNLQPAMGFAVDVEVVMLNSEEKIPTPSVHIWGPEIKINASHSHIDDVDGEGSFAITIDFTPPASWGEPSFYALMAPKSERFEFEGLTVTADSGAFAAVLSRPRPMAARHEKDGSVGEWRGWRFWLEKPLKANPQKSYCIYLSPQVSWGSIAAEQILEAQALVSITISAKEH